MKSICCLSMSMSMSIALSKSQAASITTTNTQRLQDLTFVNDLVVDVEEFVELSKLFFAQAWRDTTGSLTMGCPRRLRRHDLFFLLIVVEEPARFGSIIRTD